MIVRTIDGNNDWLFGKGRNDYLSGLNAIEQNINTRLGSFLADCFFDLGAGIDWFNLLGEKDEVALNLAINATIINTENVTGILLTSTVLDENRKLTVSYRVQTTLSVLSSDFVFDLNGVA